MSNADSLDDLLDQAAAAFSLAHEISLILLREMGYRSKNPPTVQASQQQRQEWLIEAAQSLGQFQAILRALRDAIQRPPAGYAEVADCLREATKLVLHCYQHGRIEIVQILGTWFIFNEVGEVGREAVAAARSQVLLNELQAILAASGASPPASVGEKAGEGEKRKKGGRPKADYATTVREAKLKADWERARDANPPTRKEQFASDNKIPLEDFNDLLDRVSKREKAAATAKSTSE